MEIFIFSIMVSYKEIIILLSLNKNIFIFIIRCVGFFTLISLSLLMKYNLF